MIVVLIIFFAIVMFLSMIGGGFLIANLFPVIPFQAGLISTFFIFVLFFSIMYLTKDCYIRFIDINDLEEENEDDDNTRKD